MIKKFTQPFAALQSNLPWHIKTLCWLLSGVVAIRLVDGYSFPGSSVALLLLSVMLFVAGLWGSSLKEWRFNKWLWLFVGVAVLSFALHPYPDFIKRSGRFALFIAGMLCYSPLVRTPRLIDIRRFLLLTLVVCFGVDFFLELVCAFADIFSESMADDNPWMMSYWKSRLQFVYLTTVFSFPLIAILFSIGYIKGRRLKIALLVLAALLIVYIAKLHSRIVLLSLIVVILFLIYQNIATVKQWIKKPVVIVCAIVFLAIFSPYAYRTLVIKTQRNYTYGSFYNSRKALWHDRMAEFESAPWLGVGFAQHAESLPALAVWNDIDQGVIVLDTEFVMPHAADTAVTVNTFEASKTAVTLRERLNVNINNGGYEPGSGYLLILSNLGLLGLITFLLFMVDKVRGDKPLFERYFGRTGNNTVPFEVLLQVCFLGFLLIVATCSGWILFGGSLMFPVFWLCTNPMADFVVEPSEKDDIAEQSVNG